MPKLPKYIQDRVNDKPSTRKRSGKQESRISKVMKGRLTANSGATFGQNDVITDEFEVEAKLTKFQSIPVKLDDWRKLCKKCHIDKLPAVVITFETEGIDLAVIELSALQMLINLARKNPKK